MVKLRSSSKKKLTLGEKVRKSLDYLETRNCSSNCVKTTTETHSPSSDKNQNDEVQSDLEGKASLAYEEARALLGRQDYHRGKYDAAHQMLQAIDIKNLTPIMIKTIAGRTTSDMDSTDDGNFPEKVMSIPTLDLLLEAILLNAKSLEGLGRMTDAAQVCRSLLDIFENAWPHGVPEGITEAGKLVEVLHFSLEYLPKLWEKAGCYVEAIQTLRNALMIPWNLDSDRTARLQKVLAVSLLYCGLEVPLESRLPCANPAPESALEEAILLLMILLKKMEVKEISWDPDILHHLMYGLTLSGHSRILATHVEMMLPQYIGREDGWCVLALCYCAAGRDEEAVNLLLNALRHSELGGIPTPHLFSLLLGANLCCRSPARASHGIKFISEAMQCMQNGNTDFASLAIRFLGICSGNSARSFNCLYSEKCRLQKESLTLLQEASAEDCNPDVLLSLARENAMQRDFSRAVQNVVKSIDMTQGSSASAWMLLILSLSAQKNFKDAEAIADFAMNHLPENEELLAFLSVRASIYAAQGKFKDAIDSLAMLLAVAQRIKDFAKSSGYKHSEGVTSFEMEAWLDLSCSYIKLKRWDDANICIEKAKCIDSQHPRCWQIAGLLSAAQDLPDEAVAALFTSLCIDPKFFPTMVSLAVALKELGGRYLLLSRTLLQDAFRCDPTDHETLLQLGYILQAQGELRGAADCFQEAYILSERSPVQSLT